MKNKVIFAVVFLAFLASTVAADTTTTTIYPSKYYNTDGATATKHIFANGVEAGTISGTGGTATVRYTHTDHLTGSNVITNATDTKDETQDYYPFGGIRLDQKAGSFSEQRKFAGHEYDADTGMSYMDARYFDSNIGRFTGQDPAFLSIGGNSFKGITGQELGIYLSDPQKLNSYSYVENNPISKYDPTGQFSINIFGFLPQSTQLSIGNTAQYMYDNNKVWRTAMDHPIVAGAVIGVTSGATALGSSYISGAGLVVDNLATGQLISNEGIQAIQARNLIQGNLENPKVSNLIQQLFRPQDKIGGGTIEALKRQIDTGELTGGKDHIIKGSETINRITNIQNSQTLNPAEQKGIQTISNILQKLLSNVKK